MKTAKAKAPTPTKPAQLSDLPPRPPHSLQEAVLFGALSEIDEKVMADYVGLIYDRSSRSKKVRAAGCRAMLLLATVGFSFYNWYNRNSDS